MDFYLGRSECQLCNFVFFRTVNDQIRISSLTPYPCTTYVPSLQSSSSSRSGSSRVFTCKDRDILKEDGTHFSSLLKCRTSVVGGDSLSTD